MDLAAADRESFLRELFFASALETYEAILCIDLETMECIALLPRDGSFTPSERVFRWDALLSSLLKTVHPADRARIETEIAQIFADVRPGRRFGVTLRSSYRRDPGEYAWHTAMGRVLTLDGRDTMTLMFRDINNEMADRERILDQSERDQLTGLYNRTKLAEFMAGRYRNLKSAGVYFLDLNELKDVNDNFGHEAGDRLIGLVAESLRELESPEVTPFRYGGDEFLLVMENLDEEEMSQVLKQWLDRWHSLQRGMEAPPSISLGGAWALHPDGIRSLIDKADADMYRNKHLMKAGVLPDLASRDSNRTLVGLYGRQDFYRAVDQRMADEDGQDYHMLSLGIGHFPLVNKWFGRETGDRLLGDVAQTVRTYAKDHGGIGSYLESENFALLLPADPELPKSLDNALRGILQKISPSVGFLLSIGVYPVSDRKMHAFTMLDYAAQARSRVAADSPERVYYYDSTGPAVTPPSQLSLLSELKASLEAGDIGYWFQPVCRPEDGAVTGAEALARWTHPSWGMVEPGRFIPALESAGLTAELDPVLWDRAARQLRAWEGLGLRPVPLILNVSRSDFLSLNIPESFENLVRRHGLDRSLLQAAVQDSAYADPNTRAAGMMARLREKGFRVLLDISGLPELPEEELPADGLRLDMRSLHEAGKPDTFDPGRLSSLFDQAEQRGLPLVVVGVETELQAKILRSLSPAAVQGYRYHRPMPIQEFSRFLKKE